MAQKKMRDFIVKGKRVYVGLEDSKRKWVLCVRSERRVIHETAMPAEYESLRNYLRNKFPECRITVIYEAGFAGFNLHDQLAADGFHCIVTPPHTVSVECGSRNKNDRIDARRLAKNGENDDCKACHVPGKLHRADRQVVRTLNQVQADIIRTKNRIRRTLDFHGLRPFGLVKQWSERHYKDLPAWFDRQQQMEPSLRMSFDVLLEILAHLRTARLTLLKKLRELARMEQYRGYVKILRSVPGIGPLTAIRLALEWGDMHRFKTKERFAKFTGLTPSEHSTGETERLGHITKQGNGRVRSWLVETAWILIRFDPVMLEKFNRVCAATGSTKMAAVAVARKLAIRLRTLLLTNQQYVLGVVE